MMATDIPRPKSLDEERVPDRIWNRLPNLIKQQIVEQEAESGKKPKAG